MDKHPIESIMATTMESIRDMVDVNTVVGEAIAAPDGSTVIPVSRVAFGFVAGYWLGYPKLKRECSQALGQKNTILTLYIANQPFATPLASVAPACYVFFHNVANAIQMALAVREKNRLAHAAAAKDGETEPVKSGSADPA